MHLQHMGPHFWADVTDMVDWVLQITHTKEKTLRSTAQGYRLERLRRFPYCLYQDLNPKATD